MKINDFMILYVLVCGFLIGIAIYGAISSQKYKTDTSSKSSKNQTESSYNSQFTGFEWKGHNYLKYSNCDTHTYTLLHDPDCPCITNNFMRLYQAISTK